MLKLSLLRDKLIMLLRQIIKISCTLPLLLFTTFSLAAPPLPYSANYDVRYQGRGAEAVISLIQLDNGLFRTQSEISIRLAGATISTIRESSLFEWINEAPRPQQYDYVQSGIGSRRRSINFDWQQNLAVAVVKDETTELVLHGNTLDERSMYSLIEYELSQGSLDIHFEVIDRDIVKEYHYRVVGEEMLATESGTLAAIKVERVREGNERLTQLWFAINQNMLLIKLYQRDLDGDEIEISLRNALVNGIPVSPNSL